MKLNLPARQPFSFRSTVFSHGWVQLAPFRFDEAANVLTYIDRLDSGRVLALRMREAPGGITVGSSVRLERAERAEVKRRVGWMFSLGMNLSEFYALARGEPRLARAEARAQGRILRCPTLFEDVVKTILTTNTLWGATRRMTLNLVNLFGERLPGDPGERAFPSPQRIARTSEATLRADARLGYRAPYVLELAERVASGALDLEALKFDELPTAELRKRLLAIKGIGAYAAANLLVILGRYDYLPVDSWALKMVSSEWHGGAPVRPSDVEAAFERWGMWKGLAYFTWDWKDSDA